jgi:hypothetical protein
MGSFIASGLSIFNQVRTGASANPAVAAKKLVAPAPSVPENK